MVVDVAAVQVTSGPPSPIDHTIFRPRAVAVTVIPPAEALLEIGPQVLALRIDHIQTGSDFILMRRDRDCKIVLYLDQAEGELYDLRDDPAEIRNRWDDMALRPHRDRLIEQSLRWLARGALTANRKASRAPQQAMRVA